MTQRAEDVGPSPHLWWRVAAGLSFAVAAGAICWRAQYVANALGGDYLMIWRAAHIVLDGGDPYRLIWWMKLPALQTPFNHPLPAVGMGLPFVWVRQQNAAIVFVTCSAGLLGFAITRTSFDRASILSSVPFIFTAQLSRTSLLILAFALLPAAAGLPVMQPNIGLALFACQPTWWAIVTGGALLLGAIVISPQWPAERLASARTSPTHSAPVVTGIGEMASLAGLKWRRPAARLLVAMALIPRGRYFYDELPLWLAVSSRREAVLLSGASWIGSFLWLALSSGPGAPNLRDIPTWPVVSLHLPCTWLFLRRPNVETVPDVIERAVERLPRAIRGRSSSDAEQAA